MEGRPTDGELFTRAQRGNQAAYEEIVQRYQQMAFRTAYVITGSAADAEDAAQEGFVKAYRALATFRPGAEPRPWLLRIVANEARNRVRSADRRHQLELRVAERFRPGDAAPSPEAAAVAAEESKRLLGFVNELSDGDRLVITSRYLLELSGEETAAALGIPEGTVKSRLSRALARLRERVEGGAGACGTGTRPHRGARDREAPMVPEPLGPGGGGGVGGVGGADRLHPIAGGDRELDQRAHDLHPGHRAADAIPAAVWAARQATRAGQPDHAGSSPERGQLAHPRPCVTGPARRGLPPAAAGRPTPGRGDARLQVAAGPEDLWANRRGRPHHRGRRQGGRADVRQDARTRHQPGRGDRQRAPGLLDLRPASRLLLHRRQRQFPRRDAAPGHEHGPHRRQRHCHPDRGRPHQGPSAGDRFLAVLIWNPCPGTGVWEARWRTCELWCWRSALW